MAKRLGKRTGSRFFTVDTLAHKESFAGIKSGSRRCRACTSTRRTR
jgi:hypothetical protein